MATYWELLEYKLKGPFHTRYFSPHTTFRRTIFGVLLISCDTRWPHLTLWQAYVWFNTNFSWGVVMITGPVIEMEAKLLPKVTPKPTDDSMLNLWVSFAILNAEMGGW